MRRSIRAVQYVVCAGFFAAVLAGFQNCSLIRLTGIYSAKSGGGNGDSYGGMAGTFFHVVRGLDCRKPGALTGVKARIVVGADLASAVFHDECAGTDTTIEINAIRALREKRFISYSDTLFEHFEMAGGGVSDPNPFEPLVTYCVSKPNFDNPAVVVEAELILKNPGSGIDGIRNIWKLDSLTLERAKILDQQGPCSVSTQLAPGSVNYADNTLNWNLELPKSGLVRDGSFSEQNVFSSTPTTCIFQR